MTRPIGSCRDYLADLAAVVLASIPVRGEIQFLIIKPTRYTKFSNLFLEWNSTCIGRFLCPSSVAFHCTHSNVIQVCWQLLSRSICSYSQAVSKPVWRIPLLCLQWKTPDDGQRNSSKHVEFYSKNKFEKLVHLVGIIIKNLSRCTVTWTSNYITMHGHMNGRYIVQPGAGAHHVSCKMCTEVSCFEIKTPLCDSEHWLHLGPWLITSGGLTPLVMMFLFCDVLLSIAVSLHLPTKYNFIFVVLMGKSQGVGE